VESLAERLTEAQQLVFDLLDLGVRDFGENRDQEAAPKAAEVRANSNVEHRWHFIGQLQSNKVKSVVNYASSVHSLDRQSLLDSLGKATVERDLPLDVFIQLNLTDDEGRGGIKPSNLLAFAENVLIHPGLNLVGVMGVAALDNNLDRDFGAIRSASESLKTLKLDAALISAGMSEDFETAIAYGATHLRIGSAITGKRQY
jgi:pyridoxal phosphate enzyme (YggS family)